MTCKDCIHYDVCDVYQANVVDKTSPRLCGCFKPKSQYIELPCAVGDTVYFPWEYYGQSGIAHNEVESIRIYCNNISAIVVEEWESGMPMPTGFYVQDIGKTVFLTREEAEKALERSEGK